MLCKNCNYILTGKENFCPNCASPLKEGDFSTAQARDGEKIKDRHEEILKQEYIFPKVNEEKNSTEREAKIFYDPHEREEAYHGMKRKSYAGRIMLLLFLICAFTVATFAVADYFNLTPSVFNFTATDASSDEITQEQRETYNHADSVVKPDISYEAISAYVLSGDGLTLRKGPGKSYAPLENLSDLTMVQIYGASPSGEGWVYVYCPEKEKYGWLDGSFLAGQKQEEASDELINNTDTPEEDITVTVQE